MTLIEQIKKDREAGTPGPWCVPDQTYSRKLTVEIDGRNEGDLLIPCPGSGGAMSYTGEVCTLSWMGTEIWDANARRIARVPDMEAALLAADEHLVTALEAIERGDDSHDGMAGDIARAALTAYRKATGAAE